MLTECSFRVNELDIRLEDIYLSMGYRGDTLDDETIGMISPILNEISEVCLLRCMYFISDVETVSDSTFSINGIDFSLGEKISPYLYGMKKVCLYLSTAGAEYEEYVQQSRSEGNIMKEFIADSIGTVLAEKSSLYISRLLKSDYGMKLSSPYSPGYCGWSIEGQKKLFSFFPENPCGIQLSDSFLMFPVKSVSGLFGLGDTDFKHPKHCELCNNYQCFKRKVN